MNVPAIDFYIGVTGKTSSNTATAMNALKRWGIPTTVRGQGNGARKYHGVDMAHLEEAKAKWALEVEQADNKPVRASTRSLENQKLDDILSRIRGIEVALNALMKLAKR